MSTDKASVMEQLDDAWNELREVVGPLSEIELETPGVVDNWSVKDLLGHIAFWSGRAARHLDLIAEGRNAELTGPDGDEALDEWNAREAEARQGTSLADTRDEWAQTFEAARKALDAFPEEQLDTPLWEQTVVFGFGMDTFAHYKEHANQIRTWLKQLETTEA